MKTQPGKGTAALDDRRMRPAADGSWNLTGSVCSECGQRYHPPRSRCRQCGGSTTDTTLRPEGTVVASTVVHVTRPDVLIDPPYQVVLMRLSEGPLVRMPSRSTRMMTPGTTVTLVPLRLDRDGDPVLGWETVPR